MWFPFQESIVFVDWYLFNFICILDNDVLMPFQEQLNLLSCLLYINDSYSFLLYVLVSNDAIVCRNFELFWRLLLELNLVELFLLNGWLCFEFGCNNLLQRVLIWYYGLSACWICNCDFIYTLVKSLMFRSNFYCCYCSLNPIFAIAFKKKKAECIIRSISRKQLKRNITTL